MMIMIIIILEPLTEVGGSLLCHWLEVTARVAPHNSGTPVPVPEKRQDREADGTSTV